MRVVYVEEREKQREPFIQKPNNSSLLRLSAFLVAGKHTPTQASLVRQHPRIKTFWFSCHVLF